MSPLVNPRLPRKRTKSLFQVRIPDVRFLSFELPVPSQALADFFDHLSILLASGIPLLQALEFIQRATRNHKLRRAIQGFSSAVRSGTPLSESLAQYPDVFDPIVVGMIKAAEASGHLEVICRELALSFTQRAELKSRFLQALAYPVLVASAGIVTVCVLIVFVVPKLAAVFELWDTPLPLVTRFLLTLSSFAGRGGFALLVGLVLGFIIFLRLLSTKLKRQIGFVAGTTTPFLKDLFFLKDLVRLTRTWAMLLRSGVPLIAAIQSSKDVLWNLKTRNAMGELQEGVLRGARFEDVIQNVRWFPELAKSFLSIGTASGTLDQSLEKIAAFYERELDRKLKLMATLLEPMLILAIGLVVGFLVISLLLPIFEMSLAVR